MRCSILDEIRCWVLETEKESFSSFSVDSFVLKKRRKPVEILPLLAKEFFVIAEAKKGSPSKGVIRQDYVPVDIAKSYVEAGASAISVITENHFFFGDKEHLAMVKETVDIPVLRKDFLLHPFQVCESYNLGADFVLLIAACLSMKELSDLYCLSLSLGMQVLIEIHNRDELDRVLQMSPLPRIIGINNRDLNTFKVDLNTSFRLKPLIPEDIYVISESGISEPSQVKELKEAGFAGMLVGESLLRHEVPGNELKRLMGGGKGEMGDEEWEGGNGRWEMSLCDREVENE